MSKPRPCEGCDDSPWESVRPYACRFTGLGWVITHYCPPCASLARKNYNGSTEDIVALDPTLRRVVALDPGESVRVEGWQSASVSIECLADDGEGAEGCLAIRIKDFEYYVHGDATLESGVLYLCDAR